MKSSVHVVPEHKNTFLEKVLYLQTCLPYNLYYTKPGLMLVGGFACVPEVLEISYMTLGGKICFTNAAIIA